MSHLRGTLLAGAVFAALACSLLAPALSGELRVSPAGTLVKPGPFDQALRDAAPDGRLLAFDAVSQFEPWQHFASRRWEADGHLPLWKDLSFCGAPFLGNGQSAVLFPTRLVLALLGSDGAGPGQALIKLVVAALSAFLLARHLGCSSWAALLAGTSYGFFGFTSMWLLHPHSNVSCLFPLLVWAALRTASDAAPGRLASLALVAGLMHLGGHPETTFHTTVGVVVLALVRAALLRDAGGLQRVVMGLGLGALLAAAQVVPLVEYLLASDALAGRATHAQVSFAATPAALGFLGCLLLGSGALVALRRGRRPWAWAAVLGATIVAGLRWGLAEDLGSHFTSLLAADWLGGPDRVRLPNHYIAATQGHAGPVLPLVVVGLLAGRPRGLVRGAAAVLAVGALAGLQAPLVSDLIDSLPVFSIAANQRLWLLALLAQALLAGVGLDALTRAGGTLPAGRLTAGVLVPLAAFVTAVVIGTLDGSLAGTTARQASADARPGHLEAALDPAGPRRDGLQTLSGRCHAPGATSALDEAWLLHGDQSRTRVELFPAPDDPTRARFRGELPDRQLATLDAVLWLEVRLADGGCLVSPSLQVPRTGVERLLDLPAVPRDGRAPEQLAWLAALTALTLALVHRPRTGAAPLACGLVLASTSAALPGAVPYTEPRFHYPPSPVMDALRAPGPDGRVALLGQRTLHETLVRYDVNHLVGYDALTPRHVARLLRAALDRPGAHSPIHHLPARQDVDTRLLGLMGVQLLAGSVPLSDRLGRLEYPGFRDVGFFPISTNPHFLPRARLVADAVVEPDDERVLERLLDPNFPAAREVLLDAGRETRALVDDVGPATILRAEPDELLIEVAPAARCHLVLADTWFAGWRATVDGEPRPIHRANLAFRAVEVAPGDRYVRFHYAPASVSWGARISLATLALLAALWLAPRRAGRGDGSTRPAPRPG